MYAKSRLCSQEGTLPRGQDAIPIFHRRKKASPNRHTFGILQLSRFIMKDLIIRENKLSPYRHPTPPHRATSLRLYGARFHDLEPTQHNYACVSRCRRGGESRVVNGQRFEARTRKCNPDPPDPSSNVN